MENTLPPSDQPDWNNQSFDYFKWFKFHHLTTLEKYHSLLEEQQERVELGKAYDQKETELLLGYLDQLIGLFNWLPDTEGGTGSMEKVIQYKKKFEELYLNKEPDDRSYWLAQEITMEVFSIYNYMSAICED